MTLKSEVFQGLIKKGDTQLDCTITVEHTGPLELTIKTGTYTHTDGTKFTLASDVVYSVSPCAGCPTHFCVMLAEHNDGSLVLLKENRHNLGSHEDQTILDSRSNIKRILSPMVWGYPPAGTTDVANISVYVLKVID